MVSSIMGSVMQRPGSMDVHNEASHSFHRSHLICRTAGRPSAWSVLHMYCALRITLFVPIGYYTRCGIASLVESRRDGSFRLLRLSSPLVHSIHPAVRH